jgi:hypothetical protein
MKTQLSHAECGEGGMCCKGCKRNREIFHQLDILEKKTFQRYSGKVLNSALLRFAVRIPAGNWLVCTFVGVYTYTLQTAYVTKHLLVLWKRIINLGYGKKHSWNIEGNSPTMWMVGLRKPRKSEPRWSVSRPRFEPTASRIQIWNQFFLTFKDGDL